MASVRAATNKIRRPHVMLVSSESAPTKTSGGLSHAVDGLARALAGLGCRISVFLPAHNQTLGMLIRKGSKAGGKIPIETLDDRAINFGDEGRGIEDVWIFKANIPFSENPSDFITYYFIDNARNDMFGNRELYGYADDAERYLFFNKAVAKLIGESQNGEEAGIDPPDVIHCHDWGAAYLGYFLRWNSFGRHIPLVYSIHNLGYAAKLKPHSFYLATGEKDERIYSWDKGNELYGYMCPIKSMLMHADGIVPVSETYAEEILADHFPDGKWNPYAGVLQDPRYQAKLRGIRNGIPDWYGVDYFFRKNVLPANYGADNLEGKKASRRHLQKIAGLYPDDRSMIMVNTGRWAEQKGTDLVQYLLQSGLLRYMNIQFVTVGSEAKGEHYWQRFLHFRDAYPGRVGVLDFSETYDGPKPNVTLTHENLEALALAGADVLFMPSRFEPCGLAQMYSLKLGTPAIVRATGGLKDTIEDGVTGFFIDQANPASAWRGIQMAYITFKTQPQIWQAMSIAGIKKDFSWSAVAPRYMDLYEEIIAFWKRQS
ncbi:MAG: glycogen/starch synthase [Candidatus Margulisiibacteriota bacterium]